MRDQAFRRWRERIVKNKVKKYLSLRNVEIDDRIVGITATTPKMCSNPDCCGNPRRSRYAGYSKSVQEERAEIDFQEQLEEVEERIDSVVNEQLNDLNI